jgi:hypothetical protein
VARRAIRWHVERKEDDPLGWRTIFSASGTRQYCEGWVDAMDSCYPSKPYRIVASFADGSIEIVRVSKGRAGVHLNKV